MHILVGLISGIILLRILILVITVRHYRKNGKEVK